MNHNQKFSAEIRGQAVCVGRDFPWRRRLTPYRVLVSEMMLQQTQVARAEQKFESFVQRFPNFKALARAPLHEVLRKWQGLGYNRRALYLKRTAAIVVCNHAGKLPRDPDLLVTLPGIGKNTAGAICAFAFNKAVPFIETNIRTVFIRHFFKKRKKVTDSELLAIIEKTLDRKNPREWYWALMDVGAALKKDGHRLNSRSAHYIKQTRFAGSNRELRGEILRALSDTRDRSHLIRTLQSRFGTSDAKFLQALKGLKADGLVRQEGRRLLID